MDRAVRFTISVDKKLLQKFDDTIKEKKYQTRSKAIRDLIRNYLVEKEWESSESEVMGALTLLYDHETRGIIQKLVDIQHKGNGRVISTMHLHLDKHNCMEIVAMRGHPKEVAEISDNLISCRGVKHGKLVTSSIGKHIV